MSLSRPADLPRIQLLPNELLRCVIEFALDMEADFVNQQWLEPRRASKAAFKFSLVDRRFNVLATPYIYRCIEVDMTPRHIYPRVLRTACLEDALWQSDALRAGIRAFSVVLVCPEEWCRLGAHLMLLRMLTWATNLTYFRLVGDFILYEAQCLWLLNSVLERLTSLRHLHLYDTTHCLPLDEVVAALRRSQSRIDELTLYGATRDDPERPLISSQEYRTSSIRKIALYNFENGTEDIKSLLKWPRTLTELTIGDYQAYESLDIQSLLLPHKDTLVVLDLGFPMKPDGFDFSSFTALQELRMCYWPLDYSHRTSLTEDQARRLIAPQLRHIHWYIAAKPSENTLLNVVGVFDATWLYDLGVYATRQDTQLRSISVDYAPAVEYDPAFEESEQLWNLPYPFAFFRSIKAQLKDLRLRFSFKFPLVMRPIWKNELEHERRAYEAHRI